LINYAATLYGFKQFGKIRLELAKIFGVVVGLFKMEGPPIYPIFSNNSFAQKKYGCLVFS